MARCGKSAVQRPSNGHVWRAVRRARGRRGQSLRARRDGREPGARGEAEQPARRAATRAQRRRPQRIAGARLTHIIHRCLSSSHPPCSSVHSTRRTSSRHCSWLVALGYTTSQTSSYLREPRWTPSMTMYARISSSTCLRFNSMPCLSSIASPRCTLRQRAGS